MKSLANGFMSGIGRTLARFLVYFLIGFILFIMLKNKDLGSGIKNEVSDTISNSFREVMIGE